MLDVIYELAATVVILIFGTQMVAAPLSLQVRLFDPHVRRISYVFSASGNEAALFRSRWMLQQLLI